MPLYYGDSTGVGGIPSGGSSVLIQTVEEIITSNVSISSTSYVNLLSSNITTGANFLIITLTISCNTSSNSREAGFQILVDGNLQTGMAIYCTSNSFANSGAVQWRMPILSGPHTVVVQWKNSGSGSVRIRPVTQSDAEHAVLIIQEVSN